MKSLEGWKALFQPLLGSVFTISPPYGPSSPYAFLYTTFGSEELLAQVRGMLPEGGRVATERGTNEHPYSHAIVITIPADLVRPMTPLETALQKLAGFSKEEKAALVSYWPGIVLEDTNPSTPKPYTWG